MSRILAPMLSAFRAPATRTPRAVLMSSLVMMAVVEAQVRSELAPRELEGGVEGKLPFGQRKEAVPTGPDRSAVLIERLDAIELSAGAATDATQHDFGAAGAIRIGAGVTVDHDVLAARLAPLLGRPLTEDGLNRLIDAILGFYEAHDRPVTDVLAPAQDLGGGTILLEIVEGRVGALGVESGSIFNDELLGSGVKLRGGETLRTSALQEHLDWFNRNPFRPASLYAAPGLGEGEADLVFAFSERRPWRVYAGYENTGAEAAGENRYLAGFNWGNAFGRDQLLSYQFTMGDSFRELQAHAATWEIPIHPWHHYLRLGGGWADLETESTSAGMLVESSGTSWQLSGAYGLQLPRWQNFKQEFSAGADFKSSDNFVVFGGTEAFPGSVVEIVQFRADYRATRQFDDGALDVRASLVASPGGLSAHNHDDDFELFRAGADATYLYARAGLTWVQRLPRGWSLRTTAQGQLASGALLPTEQFPLGGHDTVRGYEERDYLADHGYALSAELRAPALNLPAGKLPDTQLQFLAFLDQGIGWRDDTLPGEDASEHFLGTGLGLRAQIGSFLNLRADLAAPLDHASGLRAHLGVTASF